MQLTQNSRVGFLIYNKKHINNMKHLKIFEEFTNPNVKQFKKRNFDNPTEPKEPFQRELTKEENKFMFRHFPEYSWADVDADGLIVLGGGTSPTGMFYITEEDLAKFMEEELNESKEN